MESRFAKTSLALSICAILIAGWAAFVQQRNLDLLESQLGAIKVAAHLQLYNKESGEWSAPVDAKKIKKLKETDVIFPWDLNVRVDLDNTGYNTVGIAEFGIYVGDKDESAVSATCWGDEEADGSMFACAFPLQIDAQKRASVMLSLGALVQDELQCNRFIEDNGVVAYVKTMDGRIFTSKTNVSLLIAEYCPVIETPPE
ncbi:hypothetical protein [Glutamicibacter sp. BSL13]